MRLIFRQMKDCDNRYDVYVEVRPGVEVCFGYFVFHSDVWEHEKMLEEMSVSCNISVGKKPEEEEKEDDEEEVN